MKKLKKQYRHTLMKRILWELVYYLPFFGTDDILQNVEINYNELQCLKWRIDGVKKGRIKHDDTVPFYAFERDDECKNCRVYSECIKKYGGYKYENKSER